MNFLADVLSKMMLTLAILCFAGVFFGLFVIGVRFLSGETETITLDAREWVCTDSGMIFVPSGKSLMPISSCIQWTKKHG